MEIVLIDRNDDRIDAIISVPYPTSKEEVQDWINKTDAERSEEDDRIENLCDHIPYGWEIETQYFNKIYW